MKVVSKQLACMMTAFLMGMSLLISPARAGSFDAPSQGPSLPADTLKEVTVVEHTGTQLPLDLTFVDETGKTVKLGDYFKPNRPVVIQLGYYGCPMLCGYISQGLLDSVKQVSLKAGKDYELVFVSIDPKETPQLAASKKESYLASYGRESADGWHFLTGKQENIAALAKADGFGYKWVQAAGQFAHPAVLTLAMPDGKISRYLYGVRFNPTTLRMSIVEASNGKVGTAVDQLFLTCFQYDGHQGKYAMAAIGTMRVGGLLIFIIVAVVLGRMFLRERKMLAQKNAAGQDSAAKGPQ
jgi:protein SCO1/2